MVGQFARKHRLLARSADPNDDVTGATTMPTGPGLRARCVAWALSKSLRPYADTAQVHGSDLRTMRTIADLHGLLSFPSRKRPARIRVGDVGAEWVLGTDADRQAGVILYVHGGGFVFGSLRSHRALVRRLSAESGLAALFIEYRRAPEHPFPAAPDDILAAYRLLLRDGQDPRAILLAGDSVGGSLIATLLHDIAELDLPVPAGVLLMSPALDLRAEQALELDARRRDPMLSPRYGLRCAAAYLAGASPDDPRVAPLAQDLTGWPPTLVQVGDTESMLGDAETLAESLARAAVPHELQVWPGQVHVFQAFAGLLPEARAALTSAGRFLRSQTTPERRTGRTPKAS